MEICGKLAYCHVTNPPCPGRALTKTGLKTVSQLEPYFNPDAHRKFSALDSREFKSHELETTKTFIDPCFSVSK